MNEITIHQALYGYSDGHRLLASSSSLSSGAESVLAVLTDASGPTTGQKFNTYLSGYPVDECRFALARTWLAKEMPRPGSVWTHVLLIDSDDLGKIRTMNSLLDLFSRPMERPVGNGYTTPIVLDIDREPTTGLSLSADLELVSAVIRAMYGTPVVRAVRVLDGDGSSYEELVLAIWSQQWLNLRKSFTFCTLALEDRTLNGKPFALQVSPSTIASAGNLQKNEARLHDHLVLSERKPTKEHWVTLTVADLYRPGYERDSLRAFFTEFANEESLGLNDFPSLVDVFTSVSRLRFTSPLDRCSQELLDFARPDAQYLVDLIGRKFQKPQLGAHLKAALLGGSSTGTLPWSVPTETDILHALAVTSMWASFDSHVLRLAERARRFWQADQKEAINAIEAVLDAGPTPLGEEFVVGILACMDGSTLTRLFPSGKRSLVSTVGRIPRLATIPAVWDTPRSFQREVWDDLVARNGVNGLTRKAVIRAMLAGGADAIAEDVVSRLGSNVVTSVLDWIQDGENRAASLSPSWKRAMARHQQEMVDWLSSTAQPTLGALVVLGATLEPETSAVRRVGIEMWLRAAESAANLEPPPMDFLAVLLCIALDSPGELGARLAVFVFEPVHDAAWSSSLGDRAWGLLERRMPRIRHQWDHCERMRRAVADRFIDGRWPAVYLPKMSRSSRVFGMIVDYASGRLEGRALISKLATLDSTFLSETQNDILRQYSNA